MISNDGLWSTVLNCGGWVVGDGRFGVCVVNDDQVCLPVVIFTVYICSDTM